MAYTDDAVLSKLSTLNESHDSIATAAQWIMFHRRHADRTVQLWLQRLKDSPSPKRLNLIYLANEVTQQSKARHKDDFLVAFSPVIAEATAHAYRSAPADVQNKLRRVVEVWRDRSIFEAPIQSAIEARMNDADKERGNREVSRGSIFGAPSATGSVPSELSALIAPQQAVSKLLLSTKASVNSALQDYDKLMGPVETLPSAPVYAARLNGLLRTLANAEGAVQECVKARTDLIGSLEKLLETNRAALVQEQQHLETLSGNKKRVDDKKQEVEFAIMSGLSATDNNQVKDEASMSPSAEPDRPEVEELTPPPYERFDSNGHANTEDTSPNVESLSPPPGPAGQSAFQPTNVSGIEMLSNLASQYQSVPVTANGTNKRRRVDANEEFPDLGKDDGIDADVAEILRRESHGV